MLGPGSLEGMRRPFRRDSVDHEPGFAAPITMQGPRILLASAVLASLSACNEQVVTVDGPASRDGTETPDSAWTELNCAAPSSVRVADLALENTAEVSLFAAEARGETVVVAQVEAAEGTSLRGWRVTDSEVAEVLADNHLFATAPGTLLHDGSSWTFALRVQEDVSRQCGATRHLPRAWAMRCG